MSRPAHKDKRGLSRIVNIVPWTTDYRVHRYTRVVDAKASAQPGKDQRVLLRPTTRAESSVSATTVAFAGTGVDSRTYEDHAELVNFVANGEDEQ